MKPLELALSYMEIFYSGENLEKLHEIFGEPFTFEGPFAAFEGSSNYIENLLADPPHNCNFTLLHSFADDSSACLLYQFTKPGGIKVPMTQLFEVSGGKIRRIQLIFDTAPFF